jgi:hypothetical protein
MSSSAAITLFDSFETRFSSASRSGRNRRARTGPVVTCFPDCLPASDAARGWSSDQNRRAQRENEELARGSSPTADAIAAEIADLEALVAQRPSRATTLGAAIEDLRQREANVRRAAARRTATSEIELPDEAAYRKAVADLNRALQRSNAEAARAALRSLVGNIPVFQTGRQLAARLTMNAAVLLRDPGNVLLVGSRGDLNQS